MTYDKKIKFSENLEKLMKDQEFTVTSLASRVGMNKSTLHNYCNGVVPRNVLKIKELADVLGVPVGDLIFGDGDKRGLYFIDPDFEGRYEIIIKKVEKTMK